MTNRGSVGVWNTAESVNGSSLSLPSSRLGPRPLPIRQVQCTGLMSSVADDDSGSTLSTKHTQPAVLEAQDPRSVVYRDWQAEYAHSWEGREG